MIRRLPVISSSASLGDIIRALRSIGSPGLYPEFRELISTQTGAKNVYTTDSGIMAFYLILKALSRISPKREVILSAYTAGSLIVAIRKAGMKPVLCDVSLDDFNMDVRAITGAVSNNTLGVLAIHMFGIGLHGIKDMRSGMPAGAFLVEDCCQAMGSISLDRAVGASGDVGFFSFNRGKNLPLCGGGCITTDDVFIAKAIEEEMSPVPKASAWNEFTAVIKTAAFLFGTNPYIYGPLYALVSRFKSELLPDDIELRGLSGFQAALGRILLSRLSRLSGKRYENGIYILDGLKGVKGIRLPNIRPGERPAFNRLPIMFDTPEMRRLAEERLRRSGIESTRIYTRPLHHMFDLGYDASDFPNATRLARQLLTVPIYPRLGNRDLDNIVRTIKKVAG